MKAAVYNKKSPDKIVYSDVDKPTPGPEEVLIKVYASSINAADYRSIQMGIAGKVKIFGSDVAGIIEQVGNNVKNFKLGDEVYGDLSSCGFGGLAEYAIAPEKVLAHKPTSLSFGEAAAIPLSAVTALQGLRDNGKIKKGQDVLIVGSSGGVGTFAVQLAKFYGAKVTAVCSTRNIEQTKNLGADVVVDYKKKDFTKINKRFDLILGINGNNPLSTYKKLLKENGIFVTIGGAMSQIIKSLLFSRFMSLGSRKMDILRAKPNGEDLKFITQLVDKGKVKPVIEKYYPLDQSAEAMKYMMDGHARGKVVVQVMQVTKAAMK